MIMYRSVKDSDYVMKHLYKASIGIPNNDFFSSLTQIETVQVFTFIYEYIYEYI